MADKTELIRQQMARTRESLRQKLDALEDRTLGVVKETTEAVQSVAETVEGTVESATKAVKKTVKESARMLDLGRHVDRHPWAAMSGAVATGFALSMLLSRSRGRDDDARWQREEFASRGYQPGPQPMPAIQETVAPQEEATSSHPSLVSGLTEMLMPSIDSLKQLAIGAAVGVVKDMAMKSVPSDWSQELDKWFTNLTEQLGGSPVDFSTLDDSQQQTQDQQRPRWEQSSMMPGDDRPPPEPQQKSKKKPHGNGRHSESTTR
jgi:ElaB/YqjD/DUF883 family membrane-anchored ribosome-binding protein